MSYYELASATGLTHQAIYKLKKGDTKKPNRSTIRQLESGLNISIDEDNFTYSKKGDIPDTFKPVENLDHRSFPLSNSLCKDMQEVYSNADRSIVVNYKGDNCYAYQLKNDSMTPELRNGDYVLFDFDEKIKDGNLVGVILKDSRTFIGEFKKISNNDMVITFRNQEPIVVQVTQVLSICKIVRSWREY